LHGGEHIAVAPQAPPEAHAWEPETIPLDVRHEDDAILVLDKPAGLVMHPASGNWQGTVLNALLARHQELRSVPRAGIVHRLDKDTSGLVAVARTVDAQLDLVRQLQARTVRRVYVAVVQGAPPAAGTIDAPLGRDPTRRTRMAIVATGKPARTHYRRLEQFRHAALVECRLETGRTHQIRVHLASIGHALVGDPVYGIRAVRKACAFGRQALHAAELALCHPTTGDRMHWTSPPPADLQALIESLRED
jgi:23S rRNA pseudouridine1911/1915/1917 synthase